LSLIRAGVISLITIILDYVIHKIYLEPTIENFPIETFFGPTYYYSVKFIIVFGIVFALSPIFRGLLGTLIIAGLGSGVFGLFYGITRPLIFETATFLEGLQFTLLIGGIHFVAILFSIFIINMLIPRRS